MGIQSNTPNTDPTGRCFVSYRRTRLPEINRLIPLLNEHGIPTWQDLKNLSSEPVVEAIAEALVHPHTSSAILWLSSDVATSQVILQEEAPRILRRARKKDGFTAKLCLADGLGFRDVETVLNMPASIENPSKAWNLRPIEGNPASDDALIGATYAALRRRLGVVHSHLPPGEPLRLAMHAHALAKPAFEAGCALTINWAERFRLRHAPTDLWDSRLLPTLTRVVEAIRTSAPGRAVVADGYMSISAALALGRAFMEPSGLSITWKQLPGGDLWSLTAESIDSGFTGQLNSHDAHATDLAVFVSIRGDVEPAVRSTTSSLPAFRAILRVGPLAAESSTWITNSGQASQLARLVANQIRKARQVYPVIRKSHLFYSGPVGIAMMIGQQLNAIGPIQTYEHHQTDDDGVGTYLPAALLMDQVVRI